jgi:spore maturation protein CgeB
VKDGIHLVVLGLSLSSSWGNGHATTYRALLRAFAARGNRVTFLERDVPWYASHRDLVEIEGCELILYPDLPALAAYEPLIGNTDAAIVGSYVPDGIAVGDLVQTVATGVTAFYDIDTPVTLASLGRGSCDYLSAAQIAGYDLYLSFTGGPTLDRLEQDYGSPAARPLYCSVDPDLYPRLDRPERWDLSYLGTYSSDRQPGLERLLLEPARRRPDLRFVVAGPQYPEDIDWPANVERFAHVSPVDHAEFYAASRFTLNITRADMIAAGWSPSVRLFEAASCGTAIISDRWQGLDTLFADSRDILLVDDTADILDVLDRMGPAERDRIASAGRAKALAAHTAEHRATELAGYITEARARRDASQRRDLRSSGLAASVR